MVERLLRVALLCRQEEYGITVLYLVVKMHILKMELPTTGHLLQAMVYTTLKLILSQLKGHFQFPISMLPLVLH